MQTAPDHLLESNIRSLLDAASVAALRDIHIFPELDSTNGWALQHAQCGDACLTEHQTAGRGRRGRQWQSPPGVNIYFSLRWCFGQVPEHLPMLGLVTGLAVAEALEDCAIQGHGLKWPNDVYYDGKKLGGILLEAVGTLEQVVIGIGLNVNMLPEAGVTIDQPWTSLQLMTGKTVERNRLVAALLQRLLQRLQAFPRLDMAQFHQDWQRRDVLTGRQVQVLTGSEILEGLASGVNNHGQLLIKTIDGLIKNLSSADVSVRM